MAAGGSRGSGATLQPAAIQGLVEQRAGAPGLPSYLLPPEEPAPRATDAAEPEMDLALRAEAPASELGEAPITSGSGESFLPAAEPAPRPQPQEPARTSRQKPSPASAPERASVQREVVQPQLEPPPARLQLASTAHEMSPSPREAPRLLDQPATSHGIRAATADEDLAPAAPNVRSAPVDGTSRRTSARRECTSNPFSPSLHRRVRAGCALQLSVGESYQLSVTAGPLAWRTQAVRDIGWRSSNPAVATVDENGVVRAVSPGRVIMTVSAPGMGGSAAVIVTAPSQMP